MLERLAQRGPECAGIVGELLQRVLGGDDDRQQGGTFAVAIDEDLPDQRSAGEHGLQPRDSHELALRQLQYVVAPVDVDKLIRFDFGHDIAGAIVAVGVEDLSCDFGVFVVSRRGGVRLHQEFTPRIRLVSQEIA